MSRVSALSVTKKTLPSERRVLRSSPVDGKLAIPLYLLEGFHSLPMSQTVDDYKTDSASFAKNASVFFCARVKAAFLPSKRKIFFFHVLNEASFAGKPLCFFDGTNSSVGCCGTSAQKRTTEKMLDIALTDLSREI